MSTSVDISEANVARTYSWYYLNTYITNKTDGRIFVVDGQQRLTLLGADTVPRLLQV